MSSPRLLLAALLASLALAATAGSAAAANTYLPGKGHLLELRLIVDEAGVPTRLEIDENWLRCANSWLPLKDRTFAGLDLATADELEDRGTFSERSEGFRQEVRYRLKAWRVGEDRWKGEYAVTAKEFYRGYPIGTCTRKDKRTAWQAGPRS